MNLRVLLLGGWLAVFGSIAAQPVRAQTSMLADIKEDIDRAKLKRLHQYDVVLKPAPDPAPAGLLTLVVTEGVEARASLAELAKARSTSAKVQEKYGRAIKYLRAAVKAGRTRIELNQPETRDVDHLLAAWALPKGRVVSLAWHDQPVLAYHAESFGGGAGQAAYPEGQVFYFFTDDHQNGFHAYINIPKPRK